jgi:hypothetical protein
MEDKHMRQPLIIASAIALVTAVAAIWGTSIVAHAPKNQEAASLASSIGIVRMMKGSTNLPDENFDAH